MRPKTIGGYSGFKHTRRSSAAGGGNPAVAPFDDVALPPGGGGDAADRSRRSPSRDQGVNWGLCSEFRPSGEDASRDKECQARSRQDEAGSPRKGNCVGGESGAHRTKVTHFELQFVKTRLKLKQLKAQLQSREWGSRTDCCYRRRP